MIKISTDSMSDLDYLFEQNDIAVMPIFVVLGDETKPDNEVKPEDVYAHVAKTKQLPHTSARNEYDYEEFFKSLTADGSEVVHIAFSSELSTCCNSAIAAAKNVKGVHVVDSLSLSTGSGLLCMRAVDLVKQGKTAEEIVENLTKAVPAVQASFIVTTMEYLVKGGRCSQLASFFASVLKINPMLQLVGGKIVVGAKYRGNMQVIGERYVKDILKQYDHPDKTRIFITYTKNTPEALVDKIEQTVRENSDFKEIIRTYAGTTVTCHCGAGTIGILYINDGE